ncbi:MAG TPA: DUF2946 family protein [Roseateles sp.]|uniref:cation efflux protein, CzcI family n=1 Tax=Roseateles sp. TaxID=1971397 RepID=UPI002ED8AEE9
MRRWLIIALLFVLPLQFAWAAAAAYCGHEEAPAKTHVGHHTHEHQADPGDNGADKHAKASMAKAAKLVADTDCGYCHLSFAKPMLPLPLQLDIDAGFFLRVAPNLMFESRGPDHHDRPKWQLA